MICRVWQVAVSLELLQFAAKTLIAFYTFAGVRWQMILRLGKILALDSALRIASS